MIRKGSWVRLRRGSGKARVEARLRDIEGGVRLDRSLKGFQFWNVDDLVRTEKPKRRR